MFLNALHVVWPSDVPACTTYYATGLVFLDTGCYDNHHIVAKKLDMTGPVPISISNTRAGSDLNLE